MREFLIALALFIAVGAVGGAIMMWVAPSGNGWGGTLMLIKKHPFAYGFTLVCGIILMLWIVLEWWAWGLNPISNIYFVLGLTEAVAAVIGMRSKGGSV